MDNRLALVLAEDDTDDRRLFEDAMFHSRAYVKDVKFAIDGLELLHRLRGEGKFEQDHRKCQPDLVVIDLGMPGMDGFALLEEMKQDEYLRSIPVIVLSGTERTSDVRRCYDLGASGFMVKPDTHSELQSMFLQLTKYWSELMKSPRKKIFTSSADPVSFRVSK
ncbi:MAG: response regulator [Cohaesibacteraceae bacterium]|nr:response regulator [Cohaesibacteraceae bacterium]